MLVMDSILHDRTSFRFPYLSKPAEDCTEKNHPLKRESAPSLSVCKHSSTSTMSSTPTTTAESKNERRKVIQEPNQNRKENDQDFLTSQDIE